MKKFLYIAAAICFSTSVMAQTPMGGTMPSYGGQRAANPGQAAGLNAAGGMTSSQGTNAGPTSGLNTPSAGTSNTNTVSFVGAGETTPASAGMNAAQRAGSEASATLAQGGGLFPELGNKPEEEKKNAKDAGMIRLIIDDVTIVNPPLNGISFCVAKLTAENKTNVTINQLSVLVKYGSLDVPVVFSGVAPNGGTQDQSLAFAGQNCNSMLSLPTVTVQSCVAGPMTLGECQSKIKYVPIQ